jgi:hypothetical protein
MLVTTLASSGVDFKTAEKALASEGTFFNLIRQTPRCLPRAQAITGQ